MDEEIKTKITDKDFDEVLYRTELKIKINDLINQTYEQDDWDLHAQKIDWLQNDPKTMKYANNYNSETELWIWNELYQNAPTIVYEYIYKHLKKMDDDYYEKNMNISSL